MRVLTWNVYFGGHMFEERAEALVAELLQRRPEVIALQEATLELMLRLAGLASAGYECSDEAGATLAYGYGVVLFARVPVRGFRFFDLPTEMGRSLVTAELASGLTVATVHLESIDISRPARLAQIAAIQDRLARKDDVVWVGDMNFRPDEPEQAALDPSWVDVWPALHPDDPGYTVDTDLNAMRFQLKSSPTHKRIDRVFVRSGRWQARTIERVGTTSIDGDGTFVSDHFGLEVDLAGPV
ncbi:MAG TPA: endonuclease/exonuclease/phosphatase family protein [Kofleriaceae bacterium]|nr:endonuclease/exonuclease/phosphatase family protein [Kofleriaceae bacterium]